MSGASPIPKALLFDFGGVVVDISFDRVFQRWAELAGVPTEHVRSRFSFSDPYRRHERGEIDEAAFYAAMRKQLGIALTDAQFHEGWMEVFVGEIAETVQLLHALRGRVPLFLFSNTNAEHYAHFAPRYAEALAPFDRRFLSFELGARKPDREAFERVAQESGFALSDILFFDDTSENVEGARRCGMAAVAVRSPEDVRRALAAWL